MDERRDASARAGERKLEPRPPRTSGVDLTPNGRSQSPLKSTLKGPDASRAERAARPEANPLPPNMVDGQLSPERLPPGCGDRSNASGFRRRSATRFRYASFRRPSRRRREGSSRSMRFLLRSAFWLGLTFHAMPWGDAKLSDALPDATPAIVSLASARRRRGRRAGPGRPARRPRHRRARVGQAAARFARHPFGRGPAPPWRGPADRHSF